MTIEIGINNISINKFGNKQESFLKYDIEASLEEIESADKETKVKYEFILLSNPKNTRINVEGMAILHGNQNEVSQFLEQDKNHIPRILYSIYQELFPLLYTNSLAMQIPCPSYKLVQISSTQATETTLIDETVEDQITISSDESLPQNEIQSDRNNAEVLQKQEIEIPTS